MEIDWIKIGEGLGVLLLLWFNNYIPTLKEKWKKWKQKRNKRNDKNLDRNQEIKKWIIAIGNKVSAQRVHRWNYHNGIKDAKGMPFTQVTCSSEFVDENTSPIAQLFKGVHTSDFTEEITAIRRSTRVLHIDENNATRNNLFYFTIHGVKRQYHFKINPEDVWDGVITISYAHTDRTLTNIRS